MMRSTRIPILLLFAAGGFGAERSGALQGRVLDPSGAVVQDASVTLRSRDGSVIRKASTSASGEYQLDNLASTTYVAIAEAKDFAASAGEQIQVTAGQITTRDLTLALSRLATRYAVTASSTVQSIDEIAKALDVIEGAEITRRSVFSLSEAVRQVGGLRVMQLGGPGALSRIHARGLRTFDTSILIDGFRFRDASAPQADATGFLSDLLLADTERVEVLRGSGSSLYGTHAIGSVVNLVTDHGGGPFHGAITAEGGGLGLYRGLAQFGGGLGNDTLRYSAALGRLGVTKGVDGDDRVRNSTAHGGFQWFASPRTGITGRVWANDTFAGLNITPAAMPVSSLPNQIPAPAVEGVTFMTSLNDPDSRRESHFLSYLFGVAHQVSARASVRAQVQALSTTRDNRNGPGGPGFQPLFNQANRFKGREDTVLVRTDVVAGGGHTFSAGYEFEREDYDNFSQDENPVAVSRTSAQVLMIQSSHAVFAQDQWRTAGDRLQILLSARIQGFRLSRPGFRGGVPQYAGVPLETPPTAYTGDTAVSYFAQSTGTKLRAHVGNSYRAPALYERFGYGFFAGAFTPYGDPRIAPERAIAFDGGIDQYLASSKLRLSATYFYTRLQQVIGFDFSGLINRQTDPFGRSSGYRNTGGGLSRGVEFGLEAQPTRRLSLRSAYTYTNADERLSVLLGGSLRSIRASDHMLTLVAAQRLGKGFDASFDFFAASNYWWQMFAGGNRPFLFPGPKKGDLVLSYTKDLGERKSLRFYTRIENIFNHTYFEDGFRTPKAWAVAGLRFGF